MLVLSRKRRESIVLDGPAVVSVERISGDTVRLGIEAARSVTVHRREVWEKIRAANGQDRPEAA